MIDINGTRVSGSSFTVNQPTASVGSGGSVGSSASLYGSIASSAISSISTYMIGKAQAESTAKLAEINNKRRAIRQSMEMWAVNEQLSDARDKSMTAKLDAKVMELQAQASLSVQQAVTGAQGASAARGITDISAQGQRNTTDLNDSSARMYRDIIQQQGKLNLSVAGSMQDTTAQKISPALAIGAFATDTTRKIQQYNSPELRGG